MDLKVIEGAGVARKGAVASGGIPFPKGKVDAAARLRLKDKNGQAVPAQFDVLGTWPDGSLRWLLVTRRMDLEADASRTFTLEVGDPAAVDQTVAIQEKEEAVWVDTGRLRFSLRPGSDRLLGEVEQRDPDGWKRVSSEGIYAVTQGPDGVCHRSKVETMEVERRGPIEAIFKLTGHHYADSGKQLFRFVCRIYAVADSARVRIAYAFINDHKDGVLHPSERYHTYALNELKAYKWVDGEWQERTPEEIAEIDKELEDSFGAVDIRSVSLIAQSDAPFAAFRAGTVGGPPMEGTIEGDAALILEQVGPTHYGRLTGFRTVLRDENVSTPHMLAGAERASGGFELSVEGGRLSVGCKYFAENHPKRVWVEGNTVTFELWSDVEEQIPPEIGFGKTHELVFEFGGEDTDPVASLPGAELVASLERPLMLVCTPEDYCASGVFGAILPPRPSNFEVFDRILSESIHDIANHRETFGEYGLRDFGDQHYTRYPRGWINQEYDFVEGALLGFVRTGDPTFFYEADIACWHYMDVDVFHDSNLPLCVGAPHMHYVDHAKGEAHAGHLVVEGVYDYYGLTGNPRALEIANGISDFLVRLAPEKDWLDFRDDEERVIGWSLTALSKAYEYILNEKYLKAARIIVQQVADGQSEETGGWDHPLYPNEDKHRPVCVGGKPWMVGIILSGLAAYHRVTGEKRVEQMIIRGADWIIEKGWVEEDGGFVYMTCPDRSQGRFQVDTLEGLAMATKFSENRYYVDHALRSLLRHLPGPEAKGSGSTVSVGRTGRDVTKFVSHLLMEGWA